MKLMRARYDIIDILRNRYLRFSVNNAHARTQTVRRFVSYVQHINWKCGIVWWAEVKKRERERQAYRGNQEETVRHRARETNISNELSSSIIIPSAAASTADVRGWISTGFRHATALGTLSECVCVLVSANSNVSFAVCCVLIWKTAFAVGVLHHHHQYHLYRRVCMLLFWCARLGLFVDLFCFSYKINEVILLHISMLYVCCVWPTGFFFWLCQILESAETRRALWRRANFFLSIENGRDTTPHTQVR